MSCKHNKSHSIKANVVYLEDTDRFTLELTVLCNDCQKPFRFIGLPAGFDINGSCVSIDATEARLAIAPKDEVIPELEGGIPSGFSVRRINA